MTVVDDVDQLTEQYQLGLEEFMKGNPEPVKELFSHRDDVTLANPLGPPARGWDQVAATIERASSFMRDGEDLHCETVAKYVSAELAYTVWIERGKGQGRRKGGYHPNRSAGHDDLPTRGGRVEGRPSTRRPNNHRTASGIGDPGVALPLERTSENAVKAKFAEYLFHALR